MRSKILYINKVRFNLFLRLGKVRLIMGTIPGMMGFNPMSGTSNDFATMMLMQQMQNSGGQSVWGAGWNGNVANGVNNVAPVEGEVPQKGGFSFTKSLGYAAVGGGAVVEPLCIPG